MKNILMLTILVVSTMISMVSAAPVSQSSTSAISSRGSIIYWPRIDVDFDVGTIIGANKLSLGFQLGFEWSVWLQSAVQKELAQNASLKLVRVFDYQRGLSPCTHWNETSNTGTFIWTQVDAVAQEILKDGAEPFFVLGCPAAPVVNYIPSGMAVNSTSGLPYPDSWAAYCKEWVKHFKDAGTPVRFYEIMNEPWSYFGWNNFTRLAYFMAVFNAAAQAMRGQNPDILLGFDGTNRRPVLDYWLGNGGANLDFISFHKYDSGAIGQYTDSVMFNRAETFMLQTDQAYYGVQDAQQTYLKARGKLIPVINSESNFDSICTNGTDPNIQQIVGATWLALLLRTGILEGLSYNIYFTFSASASYEQSSKASGGVGFGMVNYDNNRPWYPYYVQYMLGNNLNVGDTLVESNSSSSDLSVLCWFHNGKLTSLLICKTDQPRTVVLNGVAGTAKMLRIDDTIPWQTPKIQTSEIDLTQPVTINGYTVALLQTL